MASNRNPIGSTQAPQRRSERRAYARPAIAVSRAHTAIAGATQSGIENPGSQGTPDMMKTA